MSKLLNGVGVNDSNYSVTKYSGGKRVQCVIYTAWANMISRCYCEKYQAKNPTYKGCTVCEEWLTFSAFRSWMIKQEYDNFHLDKDIKIKGNKVYSKDACMFVPSCINSLILDCGSKRGKLPIGVSRRVGNKRFRSEVRVDGSLIYIGLFDTPELAHEAYKEAKNKEIKRKCEQYPEFAKYLINHLL